MEIELIDNENNHVKYGIIYSRDDVDECIQQEAQEMQPDVKADGFRPGKVPVDYVIRVYGEKLRVQAMSKKITADISDIVKENKYDLASQPIYNFRPREEEGDTNFYIEVDLFTTPTLPEINFDEIELTRYIPDEDAFQQILDQNLLMFQIMTAEFKSLEDEPSEMNDRLVINVKVMIDNEEQPSLSGKIQAILGQEQVPPEIEAQLIGCKKGDDIEYLHSYAADDINVYSPDVVGKDVTYHIKIESIDRPIIKELDETRIQKLGFKDYEQLFEVLETNTKTTLDTIATRKMRSDFLNILLEKFDNIQVPEFALRQEAHQIAITELSNISDTDVLKEVTEGTTTLNITPEHTKSAHNNVCFSLFLREYARKNEITISDEEVKIELEKHLQELTRLNTIKPDRKEENYREVFVRSRGIVMENKILGSIFNTVKIKDEVISKDVFFGQINKT